MEMPSVKPEQREAYNKAEPFPHAVIDGVFPSQILEDVLAEFPKPSEIDWIQFNSPMEKKLGFRVDNKIGEKSRHFLHYLNSAPLLRWVEELTGIEGLIPDPYYQGGGLHQIERDGFLKIHADFNWHKKLELHRRINLLIYLNKDWEEDFGGHLELWDKEMKSCQKKILPLFGRCVVFNTTDFAYHGHPEPLRCPPGRSRKSIALYYYTSSRPKGELTDAHTTLFKKRDGGDWEERPMKKLESFMDKLTPPIFGDIARAMRGAKKKG
jgi:hypothetical protein